MRCHWIMPLLAVAVVSQAPELRLARQLDREAQFQWRLARKEAAIHHLMIAEWLSPHASRQIFLKHLHSMEKGDVHVPD